MFDKIAKSRWKHVVMFITVFTFVATSIVAVIVYKLSGEISGVAEVNGIEIPLYEFNYAYQIAMRNLESQNIDTQILKKEIIKQTIESLIETELLYQQAQKEGFDASSEQVKKEILNIPAFQINGKFDKQVYLQTINSLGLSPEAFEEILKKDLSANFVRAIILASLYVSEDELLTFTRKQLTKLSGEATLIKPKEPTITEQQAREYYQKHKKDYSSVQDKKVAIYRIDIQRLGQEKAELLAKDTFSKLKSGQTPTQEVEKVFEDRVQSLKSKTDIPSDVSSSVESLSSSKNILFIKNSTAYYILQYKGEISEEIVFESVRDSILQKLKNQEISKQVEKLHKSNLSITELLKDNVSTTENIENSTMQELIVKYGIKPDDTGKILNLKLGQKTPPINVRDGLLIFTLSGISEPDKASAKEMKNTLLPLIKGQKFNDTYQMYVDKLKEKAKIKINRRILEDG
ncbi:MAG: SurA N-terminal domain-containing protein [Hydrogenothermaceae bacterium]|nr:SurA N-terminal domain-containing protein [Hydrogenothermaceae bacterium]